MPFHLGDEVYVEYDGGIFMLRAGRPDSPPAIYLSRDSLEALIRFAARRAVQVAEREAS